MAKLTYFAGRGLAEPIRLVFIASGTPYEDVRLPFSFVEGKMVRPEFDALKATGALPLGQVPTLEMNGVTIWQSKAILRAAAVKSGLMGSSPEEAALIDAVCETVIEMRTAVSDAKDDDAKAAVIATKLPGLITALESNVGAAGFAIGNKLSLADIVLYHFAIWGNAPSAFGPGLPAAGALVAAAPKLGAIVKAVAANAHVAAWEAGRAARNETF